MTKYKYGYNLDEDIKNLYGSNHESKNSKRLDLFNDYVMLLKRLESLKAIIQNPVPISKASYDDWNFMQELMTNELNGLLGDIGLFVKDNHMND